MSLKLQKVRWKNLFAYGNAFTEIDLDTHKNTLLIGKNGAGKTTVIDAICYALYGKPFRKINKPQLVSTLNNKGLLVELEFNSGDKSYLVRRGMKPNIFEIIENDVLLNKPGDSRDYQDILERNIVKIGYKTATQIMILGSGSYTPFMQLVAAERRKVIEDLLDLEIFSVMFTIIKEKQTINKDSIYENNRQLELTQERIKLQEKHLQELHQNTQELISVNNSKILEHRNFNEKTFNSIKMLEDETNILLDGINDHDKILLKLEKSREMRGKLSNKLETILHERNFFSDHDNCPTCKQEIDSEFKCQKIVQKTDQEIQLTLALNQLDQQIKDLENRINDITVTQRAINILQTDIRNLNYEIQTNLRLISDYESNNKELANTKHDTNVSNLEDLKSNHELLKREKQALANAKSLIEISLSILKDGGIKSQIIKQYIPIMNKLINHYLSLMGFFVSFELNENFEEEIKSRHRDSFSYHSFSEGEKSRIDLAILFSWIQIAKMRNSASCNLLFMDEVFDSSMDTEGTESLYQILGTMTDSNLFVISHKTDQMLDKFENVLLIEKIKNFSTIKKIN